MLLLPTSEETPEDGGPRFGASVSVLGDTALVGMTHYNGVGRVAIFTRGTSGSWQRTGSIDPVGAQPGEQFGAAVALGRDIAVVRTAFLEGGHTAYVFRRVKGGWRQVQTRSDITFFTIAGNTLFQWDGPEVRVLQADSKGHLRLVQRLRSPSGISDGFGFAIAAWDRTLVISAPSDAESTGAAYVYRRRGKLWHLQQKLIAIEGQPGDLFGNGADVRDDMIAIGAPFADRTAVDTCDFTSISSGAVYVFIRRGNTWSEAQKVRSPNPDCVVNFGRNVWLGKDRLVGRTPETARRFDDGYANIFAATNGQFEAIARAPINPQGASSLDVGDHELFFGEAEPNESSSIGRVIVYALRPPPPLE
jgi:hypothetical protein